jgi:hypothetical protein
VNIAVAECLHFRIKLFSPPLYTVPLIACEVPPLQPDSEWTSGLGKDEAWMKQGLMASTVVLCFKTKSLSGH